MIFKRRRNAAYVSKTEHRPRPEMHLGRKFTSYIKVFLSKKRGDLAISAQADALTVYDNINCLYRSDFILDIKTVSVVNGVDSRV